MSYVPINWQTGDIITADKLNRCDNGWGIQDIQYFNETVTSTIWDGNNSLTFEYTGYINADIIVVTIDGVDYTCSKVSVSRGASYGAQWSDSIPGYDFSEYPFSFTSFEDGYNTGVVHEAGTYTISVSSTVLEVSSDFSNAVNKAVVIPDNAPTLIRAYNTSSVTIPAGESRTIDSWTPSIIGYTNETSYMILVGIVYSIEFPCLVSYDFSYFDEGFSGNLIVFNPGSSSITIDANSVNVMLLSFYEITPYD